MKSNLSFCTALVLGDGLFPVLAAKRAFVSIVLAQSSAYHLVVTVNRDSDDKVLLKTCERLLLKVHPDKGGKNADMRYTPFRIGATCLGTAP